MDSDSSDVGDYDARVPLEELHLVFTRLKPCTLLVPGGRGYEEEVWISFGPQYDNDWNEWMVAYNDYGVDEDEWVVRHTAWWWGNWTDYNTEFTNWFTEPLRNRRWIGRPTADVMPDP